MAWWEILIGVLVLTALTVLITGPGMWSSTWGWGSGDKKRQDKGGPRAPPR